MRDTLDDVVKDRRLDREDFEIQIEAAQRSVALGYYAIAIAELRGAILVLQTAARRTE